MARCWKFPIDEVEEDDQGEVWHFTAKPLTAGTPVHAAIDWERRLDHMQQHSGQHLLSALFSRELGAHTVSFHLGEKSSTIDLNAASISHASLERIERMANQVIAEDRPLSMRAVARADADAMLAEGHLRKLPEREGEIRLIEIEGVDLNACGGTHVLTTGQIGGVALRSTEKVRNGLRVEFVCGLRAITAARNDFHLISEAATALSASRDQVPRIIERLLAEAKHAAKQRQKLREELARFEAAELLTTAVTKGGALVIRQQFSEHDAEYVKLLASKIAAANGHILALIGSTHEEPAAVVMARGADLKVSCGDLIKSALAELGLRGGGSPTFAQGQLPAAQLATFFDRLEAEVRAMVGVS